MVSDNGSPFQSEEFKSFVEANGIVHHRVPPYHPASNGAAENLVKQSLEKSKSSYSLKSKIAGFLSSYRNTPHTVTGRTLAEVLLGRAPRTRPSLVHSCLSQALSAKAQLKVGSTPLRSSEVGQEVIMCDHRPSTESKWRKAKILSRLGPLTYEVISDQQTRTVHVDHLLPADGTVSGKEQLTTETKHDPKPEKTDTPAKSTVTCRPFRSRKPWHRLISEI